MSVHRHPGCVRGLDAYRVALELVSAVGSLLPKVQRFDKNLGSQLQRAVCAVPLNIAEGMRRTGLDRAHLLTVALGSVAEVLAVLQVCVALRALTDHEIAPAAALGDRDAAMLYRLHAKGG